MDQGCLLYTSIGIEWLITMANFINFATCPGNAQRAISEEANYYVGYSTISFFNKIRMGIYATGMKLLIGNWLFFMFAILLAVLVIRKQKQLWKRIFGLIPLGIAIVFGPLAPYASRVFWVIDRIPDGGTLYGDPAAIGTVMVGREILMFALILIAAVTVLLSLYWIFGKSTLTWCLMFAVIMGYACLLYTSLQAGNQMETIPQRFPAVRPGDSGRAPESSESRIGYFPSDQDPAVEYSAVYTASGRKGRDAKGLSLIHIWPITTSVKSR